MHLPVFALLVLIALILLAAITVCTESLIHSCKTKVSFSAKIVTNVILALLFSLVIAVMVTGGEYKVTDGKVLVTDNQDVFTEDVYYIYTNRPPDLIDMKHSVEDMRISVRSKEFDRFFLLVQGTAWWDELDKDQVAVFQSNYSSLGMKQSLEYFLDWGFEREIIRRANICGDEIASEVFPDKIEKCLNYFLNLDKEEIGMDRFHVMVKAVSEENYKTPEYRSTIEDCYKDAEVTICRESEYKI